MIELLPRRGENVVGARLQGRVRADEYRRVLVAEVDRRVEERGRYRLLLVAGSDFEGFDDEVRLEDPEYGLAHRRYLLERFALVGSDPGFALGVRLAGHLASEWMRVFSSEALEEAWSWVLERTSAETAVGSARRLLGAKIVDRLGEELGEVEDLVFDASTGSLRLVVVAFGGFLGLGERSHPIPWRLFRPRADGTLLLRLHEGKPTAEQLSAAPSVDKGHSWHADPGTFSFATHPFFGGPRW
ncbi:MAG: hypothetical protein D6731_08825 [Planctomycetota bacterium]|nr:MAG: hypothetical protein D6731_08825 [Planctomycetota bacterium]